MKALLGSLAVLVGFGLAWAADPVPEFKLVDVNPSSIRKGAQVSPRDYLLQVSGYYFGAAG